MKNASLLHTGGLVATEVDNTVLELGTKELDRAKDTLGVTISINPQIICPYGIR